MKVLGKMAIAAACCLWLVTPATTLAATTNGLLFQQNGASRDHTLAPFSIAIGLGQDESTREQVFVTPHVYATVFALVRDRVVAQGRNCTQLETHTDFTVIYIQRGVPTSCFGVSNGDVKAVLGILRTMFQDDGVQPPEWILAIANGI
jgi:hypothetical protein